MSNKELEQSFLWCVFNNDVEAWEALSMAYLQRGYVLNAAYCLERAESMWLELTFTE